MGQNVIRRGLQFTLAHHGLHPAYLGELGFAGGTAARQERPEALRGMGLGPSILQVQQLFETYPALIRRSHYCRC